MNEKLSALNAEYLAKVAAMKSEAVAIAKAKNNAEVVQPKLQKIEDGKVAQISSARSVCTNEVAAAQKKCTDAITVITNSAATEAAKYQQDQDAIIEAIVGQEFDSWIADHK